MTFEALTRVAPLQQYSKPAGWAQLPSPLLQMVFSYLKPHESVSSHAVCTRWSFAYLTHVKSSFCTAFERTVDKLIRTTRESLTDEMTIYDGIVPEVACKNMLELLEVPDASEVQLEAARKLIARCEGNLKRLPDVISAQLTLLREQKIQMQAALTLDRDLYTATKRRVERSKTTILRLTHEVDECLQRFPAFELVLTSERLTRIQELFLQLVRTLPSFKTLRSARNLTSLRKQVFKAVQSLLAATSYNFAPILQPWTAKKTLLKSLLKSGQDYALPDLFPLVESEGCPNDLNGHPLTSTKVPHLLSFRLENKGWCITATPTTDEGRASELVGLTLFAQSRPVFLVQEYALRSEKALVTVLDALLEQKRHDEILDVLLNERFTNGATMRGFISRFFAFLLAKEAIDHTWRGFDVLPERLAYSRLRSFYSDFLLGLIIQGKKREALVLCQKAEEELIGLTSDLPSREKIELLRWKVEGAKLGHYRDNYTYIDFEIHLLCDSLIESQQPELALTAASISREVFVRRRFTCLAAKQLVCTGRLVRLLQIGVKAMLSSL